MSHRANAHLLTLLCACAGVLVTPGFAEAASGGAGLSPSASPLPAAASPLPTSASLPPPTPSPGLAVAAGNLAVTATGGGLTLTTHTSAFLETRLAFTGTAPARDRGDTVEIERLGRQTDNRWSPTAEGRIGPGGAFAVAWRTNHIGRFAVRAVVQRHASARAATASPTVTITVYRSSIATQYGPGLFGHETACGIALRPSTLGVANRTLPCGTLVAIYYRGRTAQVPVIDRGPYANGADWDLTVATARALGIPATATIGAVSLPR